jgi:hypothetical protein
VSSIALSAPRSARPSRRALRALRVLLRRWIAQQLRRPSPVLDLPERRDRFGLGPIVVR